LIGWLPEDRATALLRGRREDPGADEAQLIQSAHESAAAREPVEAETDVVRNVDPALDGHVREVVATEGGAAMLAEGWEVKLVDLRRVRGAQPVVFSDEAEARVADVDPQDIVSIAQVTLPMPQPTELPAQFDEAQRAWIFSSPNPNLKIVGHFGAELQPGVMGFGFIVRLLPSFLSVALFEGKPILRDGYHRAYGLLRRGIHVVPAFVREVPSIEAIGFPQGMVAQELYLGSQPPRLPDYLDDDVAADIVQPVAQKMLVIHGLEITPIAQNR
jgi:hypothetical protein